MVTRIEFNKSAFKHGYTKIDIVKAFESQICDELITGEDNKYVVVGFDSNTNPIEVFYNRISEDHVYVFHAMECRDSLLEDLGLLKRGK